MAARARPLRVQPSRSEYQRARRAQMGGAEVSAERHKSDCRSTAGEDQQGLRVHTTVLHSPHTTECALTSVL